ncbi:hypothetical protein MGN70_011007 [Eutypa lata]|uniref:Putative membrane protein n=1 Tax=Eutypa lata (strain UCR-EL1) TaxID=1287681 RepID=M7SDR9_EUTLA|nr:putative membrane protein [Eutypa lata UCREL1]KAI1247121.1 hypothetical protein MGN70_011007 [Eutypa lata]
MASFIDLNKNYSIFAIPTAVILGLAPIIYGRSVAIKAKLFDNKNPRGLQEAVKGAQKIDQATKNRLIRCEAASANAQETLPLFSCAVLAASVGGVPAPTVNAVAAAYLATRVVYNVIYVWLQGANSRKVAYARSLSWFAGVACWMTLFVKAGFAFSEGGAE